jgi:hypothetical protein
MVPGGFVPGTDQAGPLGDASPSCPICGVWLDPLVLSRPDDEYFCPVCCTQQKPGRSKASPIAGADRVLTS